MKAAVICGTLYFFVMEMQPVRIILRSLTFEEYLLRLNSHKNKVRLLFAGLVFTEGTMEYFVWY